MLRRRECDNKGTLTALKTTNRLVAQQDGHATNTHEEKTACKYNGHTMLVVAVLFIPFFHFLSRYFYVSLSLVAASSYCLNF